MIRTQVYLPQELYGQIITLAKLQGIPLAEVIREALKRGVEEKRVKEKNDLSTLSQLAIKGGPKDLSQNLDKYLYEKKK